MKFRNQNGAKHRKTLEVAKSVASSLLWKENRSKWFQYVIEISSNVQLVAIALSSLSLYNLPDSDVFSSSVLQELSRGLVTDIFLFKISTHVSLILINTYFFCVLLLFGFMGYKSCKNIQVPALQSFFTYCTQLHHSVFFWGINVFLISTLVENKSDIALVLMSTFSIIFNYLFAAIGVLFCYSPFFTENPFDSSSSKPQTLLFVYKAIMSPIVILISDAKALQWTFSLLSTILTLLRQEFLLFEMPYYKHSTLKLQLMFSSFAAGIAIVNVIGVFLCEYEVLKSTDIIYCTVIVTLFLLKLNMTRLNNLIFKYISSPRESQKTQRDVFKRILASQKFYNDIQFFVSSGSSRVCNIPLLYFMGDMSYHSSICKQSDCLCKYASRDKMEKYFMRNLFEIHRISIESKANSLVEAMTRINKTVHGSNLYKLILAHIFLKHQRNFSACLFTLYSVNQAQQTFHESVIFKNIRQQLEGEMSNFFGNPENRIEKDEILDIKRIVDLEENSSHIFKLIAKNTQTFLQLWSSFREANSSLREFLSLSIKVETEADQIEQTINRIFLKQKHFSLCICLYSCYLAIIRNMPSKAGKLAKYYNDGVEQKVNKVTGEIFAILGRKRLDESGDIIFYVSMARERIGRVLHVSRNIQGELGWNQSELIGQNINMLQPSVIKEKHDHILMEHVEGVRNYKSHNTFESYIRRKQGYYIPVHGYVSIFPYVQNEPIYVGVIGKKQINEEFLLIRTNGIIDAFSEKISKDLEFPHDKKINIDQICLNFQKTSRYEMQSATILNSIQDLIQLQDEQEIVLSFKKALLFDNKRDRGIKYIAKVESYAIADQQCICLHLTEKRISDITRLSLSVQPDFLEEIINRGPRNTDIYCSPDSRTRKSQDSLVLLSSPNFERKTQRRQKLCQANGTRKGETFLYSNRKASNELCNTMSNLLMYTSNLSQKDSIKDDSSPEDEVKTVENTKTKSTLSKEKVAYNDKLEKAVYVIPKHKYTKTLNYLVFVFTLLCAGFLFYHLIGCYSDFNLMFQLIDLITACHRRTLTMVTASGTIELLALITQGVLSDSRHSKIGVSSWRESLQASLLEHTKSLNFYNLQVSELFYILDEASLKAIFNDRVVVGERGNYSSDYTGLFSDLATSLIAVSHSDANNITTEQPEVKFVIDNSFNQLLRLSERMIVTAVKSSQQHLLVVKEKTLVLLLPTLIIGTVLVALLSIDIKYFLNNRNRFIDILLRLDQRTLRNHIDIVNDFHQSLQSNLFNYQVYWDIKEKLSCFTSSSEPKQRRQQRLYKSQKNLNIQIIRSLLLTIIIIAGFASAFIFLFIKYNLNTKTFLESTNVMTSTFRLNTNLKLLDFTITNYMIYNNTTKVRNKPIEKGLSEIFNLTQTFPDHLSNILADYTETENEDLIQSLILRDLCQVVSLPELPSSFCADITGSVGAGGLIAMTNFLVTSYGELKSLYDVSNHTMQAAIEVLGSENKITGERIGLIVSKGILTLEDILRENLKHKVSIFLQQEMRMAVSYSCVYVALGLILSLKILKNMKIERDSWRKVVRQIPFSIISSNKVLKAYVINNCEGVLDSFKNIV